MTVPMFSAAYIMRMFCLNLFLFFVFSLPIIIIYMIMIMCDMYVLQGFYSLLCLLNKEFGYYQIDDFECTIGAIICTENCVCVLEIYDSPNL